MTGGLPLPTLPVVSRLLTLIVTGCTTSVYVESLYAEALDYD